MLIMASEIRSESIVQFLMYRLHAAQVFFVCTGNTMPPVPLRQLSVGVMAASEEGIIAFVDIACCAASLSRALRHESCRHSEWDIE